MHILYLNIWTSYWEHSDQEIKFWWCIMLFLVDFYRISIVIIIFFFIEILVIYQEVPCVAQRLKHLPAMQETWVRSLGQEDPLEEGMATHSSTPA